MAKLGPEIITEEINIDEDDSSTDTEANAGPCNSVHCQQQIKGKCCCWAYTTTQGKSSVQDGGIGWDQRSVWLQIMLLREVTEEFPGKAVRP